MKGIRENPFSYRNVIHSTWEYDHEWSICSLNVDENSPNIFQIRYAVHCDLWQDHLPFTDPLFAIFMLIFLICIPIEQCSDARIVK